METVQCIHCPRGAKPGDVLDAARTICIGEYARPKILANSLNDLQKLPILIAVPVLFFIVVGLITGLLDFTPEPGRIVHAKFFSTWLVDIVMLPAAIWTVVIFALGIKSFMKDIHNNSLMEGKTKKEKVETAGLIKAFLRVIPAILKHEKFDHCTEYRKRSVSHLLVLFGFIGLFIVTAIFFIHLTLLQWHGPYSQLHPVKWLANLSSVALFVGSGLLIKNRLSKTEQKSTYKDWYLIYLAFGLGVSGMATQVTRIADWTITSYTLYSIHLVFMWC